MHEHMGNCIESKYVLKGNCFSILTGNVVDLTPFPNIISTTENITKGQSKKDNPEKRITQCTQDEEKQKDNAIFV